MNTSSPEINKVLRRVVNPGLRDLGFSKLTARRSWKWLEDVIWVFEIRAVGKYFSEVTGWPPMSVCVWTGIYYDYIPPITGRVPKTDHSGRALPSEVECHSRSHLTSTLDQRVFSKDLSNGADQVRDDIWWIEYDGSNTEQVAQNISSRLVEQGAPWYERLSNPWGLLQEVEKDSCYQNWFKAMHIARKLGDAERGDFYKKKVDEFKQTRLS